MLRAALCMAALGVGAALVGPALAQTSDSLVEDVRPQSAVVTLDRARLFEETRMGQAILARIDIASTELNAENRRLEAALEAEERLLTERRPSLSMEEFRELAREFDSRVEELRVTQEAKIRSLTRRRDLEQQRFFEASAPMLAELMQELGAVAIIDRSAVILSFDRVDITTQAIAWLDRELGDGSDLLDQPEPESQPDGAQAPLQSVPAQP